MCGMCAERASAHRWLTMMHVLLLVLLLVLHHELRLLLRTTRRYPARRLRPMEESNLRRLLSREASDQAAHQDGAGSIGHRSVSQPASKPFKAVITKLRVG